MTSATAVKIRLVIATPIPRNLLPRPARTVAKVARRANRYVGERDLVPAEPVGDDPRTGGRPLLGQIAVDATIGGILAIDRAVVGETAGVIVEQHLTAVAALLGHVEDRSGIDFPGIAGRRCRSHPVLYGEIIGDGEQAGAEQGADRDHAKALADALGAALLADVAAVHGTVIREDGETR